VATFEVSIEVDGLGAVTEHFDRMAKAIDRACKDGVSDAVNVLDKAVKDELTRTSHPLGTPTPAPPGSPPSLVTGNLRRSVRKIKVKRIAKGVYEGGTGPTAVYARIQELSGWAGRHHRSFLPARPYARPARKAGESRAIEAFKARVRRAIE